MYRSTTTLLIIALMAFGFSGAWAEDKIPTRQFVDDAEISSMKIAPDGRHVALTYEEGTQVKLAVIELESQEITAAFDGGGENRHVLSYWWGNNSRVVMAIGKVTGNLDNMGRPQQLVAGDIDGGNRKQIFNTSERGGYQMLHPLPDDDRRILISRYHYRDRGDPRPLFLDIYDGEIRPASDLPLDGDIAGLIADNDGELRGAAAVSWGDNLDDRELRLYLKHEDDWRRVDLESKRPSPAIDFLGFSADNQQVFFRSNHDMEENDRRGVFRYDFETEQTELLYRHDDMDVGGLLRGPEGEVLGTYTRFGPMNYHFFEDKAEEAIDSIRLLSGVLQNFPDDNVTFTSASQDGSKVIVSCAAIAIPASSTCSIPNRCKCAFYPPPCPTCPPKHSSR